MTYQDHLPRFLEWLRYDPRLNVYWHLAGLLKLRCQILHVCLNLLHVRSIPRYQSQPQLAHDPTSLRGALVNSILQVHRHASEYIATVADGMNLQLRPNPTEIGLPLQSFGGYCRLEVVNVLEAEFVRNLP